MTRNSIKSHSRTLPLVEAISRDFNDQLLCILTSQRLPYTPYDTFEHLLSQTHNVFRKTFPKCLLTVPFNLWKRSDPTRNSIKSVSEIFIRDMDPPSSLASTNGSLNHQEPETTSAFNAELFRSYLLSLLSPVIGAYPFDLNSLFDE